MLWLGVGYCWNVILHIFFANFLRFKIIFWGITSSREEGRIASESSSIYFLVLLTLWQPYHLPPPPASLYSSHLSTKIYLLGIEKIYLVLKNI